MWADRPKWISRHSAERLVGTKPSGPQHQNCVLAKGGGFSWALCLYDYFTDSICLRDGRSTWEPRTAI